MLDNVVDITERRSWRPADEQQAVVQAIDDFVANPSRPLLVVHGPSGASLSRIRAAVERRYRYQDVRGCMAGAVAARQAEIISLGRLLGRDRDRSWLRGVIILLDGAAVARGAEVAELRRAGARIVALVDPALPPPVHGTDPDFRRPDIVLAERHPTTLVDPIRTQARAVLAGRDYRDDGHTVRVKKNGNRDDLLAADIVLCAPDATRRRLNQCARVARRFIAGPPRADGGFDPTIHYPRGGELVLIRRSDELPRGEIATLWEPFTPGSTNANLLVHDCNGGLAELAGVRFGGMPCPLPERAILNEIDFGYAISALEIQGAQWEHVLLIDEMRPSDPLRPAWLYAVFCAAKTSITIIRKHKQVP